MFSSGVYWDSSRILDIPERESSVEWVWHWDGPVSWRCEILLGLGLASRKHLYWPHRAACCVTEGEEGLPDLPWWTITVIILHAGLQVLGLCQLLRAWRMARRMHMPCFRNRKKKMCPLCFSSTLFAWRILSLSHISSLTFLKSFLGPDQQSILSPRLCLCSDLCCFVTLSSIVTLRLRCHLTEA